MRAGNWKFNTAGQGNYGNPRRNGAPNANTVKPAQPGKGPQLFDLSTDLGESKNLATEMLEKLKEMQELLANIRGR